MMYFMSVSMPSSKEIPRNRGGGLLSFKFYRSTWELLLNILRWFFKKKVGGQVFINNSTHNIHYSMRINEDATCTTKLITKNGHNLFPWHRKHESDQTKHDFFFLFQIVFIFDTSIKFDINNFLSQFKCFTSHNMIKFVHEFKHAWGEWGYCKIFVLRAFCFYTQEYPWSIASLGNSQ